MQSMSAQCAVLAALLLAYGGSCVHLFDSGHELQIPETNDDVSLETLQQMETAILNSQSLDDMKLVGGVANVSKDVTKTVDIIVLNMLKKINVSHDKAEVEISHMPDPFYLCNKTVKQLPKWHLSNTTFLKEKHKDLKGCLEHVGAREEAAQECDDFVIGKHKLFETCDDLDNKVIPVQCEPVGDLSFSLWVENNYEYFKLEKEKKDKQKKDCSEAKKAAEDKEPECQEERKKAKKAKKVCDKIKREMEERGCNNLIGHTGTCESSKTCWETERVRYYKQKALHQEMEKMRKAEWRASKRIECLIKTFHKVNQNETIDLCIAKRHSTKHLDLTFPPYPKYYPCPPPPVAPCDHAFKETYNLLAEDCHPCLEETPKATGLADEELQDAWLRDFQEGARATGLMTGNEDMMLDTNIANVLGR